MWAKFYLLANNLSDCLWPILPVHEGLASSNSCWISIRACVLTALLENKAAPNCKNEHWPRQLMRHKSTVFFSRKTAPIFQWQVSTPTKSVSLPLSPSLEAILVFWPASVDWGYRRELNFSVTLAKQYGSFKFFADLIIIKQSIFRIISIDGLSPKYEAAFFITFLLETIHYQLLKPGLLVSALTIYIRTGNIL